MIVSSILAEWLIGPDITGLIQNCELDVRSRKKTRRKGLEGIDARHNIALF